MAAPKDSRQPKGGLGSEGQRKLLLLWPASTSCSPHQHPRSKMTKQRQAGLKSGTQQYTVRMKWFSKANILLPVGTSNHRPWCGWRERQDTVASPELSGTRWLGHITPACIHDVAQWKLSHGPFLLLFAPLPTSLFLSITVHLSANTRTHTDSLLNHLLSSVFSYLFTNFEKKYLFSIFNVHFSSLSSLLLVPSWEVSRKAIAVLGRYGCPHVTTTLLN